MMMTVMMPSIAAAPTIPPPTAAMMTVPVKSKYCVNHGSV